MQENVAAKDQTAKLGMFHIKVCYHDKSKICVVFDWSSHYRRTSINKNFVILA